MPKLIDHAARREEFAEAVWRVVLREGVSAVSVRTVAAEAGASSGALRHVLPTKADLLVAAMQLVDERVSARAQAHLDEPDARRLVLAVLEEFLPLDERRRAELEVNLALVAEAPANAGVRAARDEAHEHLRAACRGLVGHLAAAGLARPDVDVDEAGDVLHALVDGLAVHLLVDRSAEFAARAQRVVVAHVDALRPGVSAGPAAPPAPPAARR